MAEENGDGAKEEEKYEEVEGREEEAP